VNPLRPLRSRVLVVLASSLLGIALWGAAARADVVDPQVGLRFRLATPIHNLSYFKVWPSRYEPGDALPEHMTFFFQNLLKESPLITATLVDKELGAGWPTHGFTPDDVVLKINLEDAAFTNRNTMGSKMTGRAFVRMTVYRALTKDVLFTTVVKGRETRWNPEYLDILDKQPVLWKDFERTVYWMAIQDALRQAANELLRNYTGYRILGRLTAVATPAEGLEGTWDRRAKRFHINLGRDDSLKVGDVLAVTRASAARTVDAEEPVMLYPQVVGKVKVVFLQERDGVVQVVSEHKRAPLEPGDALSVPILAPRKGQL